MTGPTSSNPDDALRVGHAEREQVVALLGESMSGGYLTLDEFEHRVTLAHEAANRGELRAVLTDLPAMNALRLPGSTLPGAPTAAGGPAGAGMPGGTEEVELRGSMDATVTRRGAWQVPSRLRLTGTMATFKLDLNDAQVPLHGIDIDVQATWSTVRIWLSPSMRLVPDEFTSSMWITLKDKAGAPTAPAGVAVSLRGKPWMSTVVVRRAKG